MNIRAYLTSSGCTQSEFAKRVGVTQSMVGHWISGRCRITAEMAVAVERATSAAVTREELRPDVFGEPSMATESKSDVGGERAHA